MEIPLIKADKKMIQKIKSVQVNMKDQCLLLAKEIMVFNKLEFISFSQLETNSRKPDP